MATPRWAAPPRVRMTDRSFCYRSAPCGSAGVLRLRRSRLSTTETEWWTDFPGTTMPPTAMARFGSSWRLRRARPPRGSTRPQVSGTTAGALPVPSGVSDGGARCGAGDGRLLGGASGADDGLSSFSPIDEEPASPAGPDEAVLGTAAAHNACSEGVTARGGDLPLLADTDEGHEEGRRVDGTRSPGAGAGGFPPCAGAAEAGAQPRGVVSPPAITVFGGGIGVAPAAGAGDNANIAHSVGISDSDSDLGVSTPATTATNEMAAAEGPGGAPSLPSFGGALQ